MVDVLSFILNSLCFKYPFLIFKTLFTLERIQIGTDPKWIRSNFFRVFTLDRIQISARLHWELDWNSSSKLSCLRATNEVTQFPRELQIKRVTSFVFETIVKNNNYGV